MASRTARRGHGRVEQQLGLLPAPAADRIVYERALRQDEAVRGTGRVREETFRMALWDFAQNYAMVLPPVLYELILDHLTRTDMMDLSLCFNGPLRHGMLAEVMQWLGEGHVPSAHMRWQALMASQIADSKPNEQEVP